MKNEGVSPRIISQIEAFRAKYPTTGNLASRVPAPRYLYYGKDVWEEAATAFLCGENLLLVGPKATGKNVLAENLAAVFGRPSLDVSFYINTDAATLLGTDTFQDSQVYLRQGPIYQCAESGGFGVLDEINTAKNESLDLRGLSPAVRLMHAGLEGNCALELGMVNKSFDDFERQPVKDVISARLPDRITYENVFA